MKLLIFSLVLAVISLPLKAQRVVNDPNAELRTVKDFRAISISGGFQVYITQGSEEGLAVSASDAGDVVHIKTEVDKGVLKIWFDEKTRWFTRNRKLKAYISVKNLDQINASGATTIEIDGGLSSSDLVVKLSGASDLKGTLNVSGNLKVSVSGASDINIKGNARDLRVDASGASKFTGYDFTAGSLDSHASGASKIQITVEREISASLSGASSLRYKGNAVIKDIKTSGASSISRQS